MTAWLRPAALHNELTITDLTVELIRNPNFATEATGVLDAVIVRVHTDAGITGIGEASSAPQVVRSAIDAPGLFSLSQGIRELLIGRDPLQIGVIWELIYRHTLYPGHRGAYLHALSAIDIALWDILGKATELPIYKLLGGAFQSELRAYASCVMPDSADEVRATAAQAVAAGWPAVKLGWFPYHADAAQDMAFVRAAREGAGSSAELMLDVGSRRTEGSPRQGWDAKTAIQRITSWEEAELLWVEEPLPADDIDGYRRLTDAVTTHIAAGEQETTRFPLFDLMERGGIDIVQCDIARVGGLTEARRVSEAAHDRNRLFAPHCFATDILLAASAHLSAASPTFHYLECPFSGVAHQIPLVHPSIHAVDGIVTVPEGPGLGVELDEDLIASLRIASA